MPDLYFSLEDFIAANPASNASSRVILDTGWAPEFVAPSLPASGVTWWNDTGFDCRVHLLGSILSATILEEDGVTSWSMPNPIIGMPFDLFVKSKQSLTLVYTGTPAWTATALSSYSQCI